MLEASGSIRLLDADPDLAAGLETSAADEARVRLVARSTIVQPGSWDPRVLPEPHGDLGVLVTEGLMLRDVVVAGTRCAELVGRGDLLRPWDDLREGAPIRVSVEWQVLEPTRIALIDRRLVQMLGAWPEIMSVLTLRAVARAQGLALSLAINGLKGLERRVLVLLWHLADRWGRVAKAGVVVPLPLTHEIVARLVGARRPSVSTALKKLQNDGAVTPRPAGGWILHGDPPPVS